jgi:tRNA-uridine 2-sulfurtransferase
LKNSHIIRPMKSRVLVAMSGGVDSSVAAYLLKKQGYEVIGITFQVYDYSRENRKEGKGGCCSIEDVDDARVVADKLGIRHYLTDTREAFRSKVIDYFLDTYKKGETPNPCVACNSFIKFDELAHFAKVFDAPLMATGHYAQMSRVGEQRFIDSSRDQSYFLMGVAQEHLDRLLFPCGEYTKDQIRDLAIEAGLCVGKKKDSMEICFIPNNDYRSFLKEQLGDFERPGEIVDERTHRVLGSHQGVHAFTVGQRKGLGSFGLDAFYVTRIDSLTNRVYVGEAKKLFSSGMRLDLSRFQHADQWVGRQLTVKIRSRAPEVEVALLSIDSAHQQAVAQFNEPQRAVTPGQYAVFYDGARVVGGGAIQEALAEVS